jgi:hypothetical protein
VDVLQAKFGARERVRLGQAWRSGACTETLITVHNNKFMPRYPYRPEVAPPPDVCIQSVGICVAMGQEAIHSYMWSGCHIFVPAPHAPGAPLPPGYGSKIVSLPTSGTSSCATVHCMYRQLRCLDDRKFTMPCPFPGLQILIILHKRF